MAMLTLDVKRPFSFERTLEFMARFAPCRDACVLAPGEVSGAVAIAGRAHALTIHEANRSLVVEVANDTPASARRILRERAAHFIGADDDLAPFYAAAEGDRAVENVIAELHGLHHVRFLTLGESVVFAILMQRAPQHVSAALKRRFLSALGLPVTTRGHTLHAMPELAELATLTAEQIASAIGHRPKAERIATAVRAVHALGGEEFLRSASYDRARDALLAIDGIGPFAATAILLRGLGRMDALPWMPQFARAARTVYGRNVTETAIVRRYGRHIGYWSFYVMTAAGRRRRTLH